MEHEQLFGRDAEMARVDEALRQAAAGNNGLLVLRGPAGSGKSALLDAAVARAGDDVTLLRTTGVEVEQTLAFSGLYDICRPLLEDLSRLDDHHQQALRAAFGQRGPVPVDRFTCGAATLALLTHAAARGPVLLAVDDWQWVDEATAQALAFVLRRLSSLPVLALVGVRDEEPVAVDLGHAADLHVGPLDDVAAAALVRSLAEGSTSSRVVAHLVAAGSGNPLALTHLVGTLTAHQLAGRALLPWPLPDLGGPRGVFAARHAELPEDTRAALVVTAASVSGSIAEIGRALRAQGLSVVDLEPAEKAELVEIRDGRVVFTHPLARTAAYAGSSAPDQRRAHAALAAAVDAGDASEHRLLHEAMAAPGVDEKLAAALEAAAADLRARGAFGSAARLLERSAHLGERTVDRHRRLAAGADAALAGGYLAQALDLADGPATEAGDSSVRALAIHVRARCRLALGQRGIVRELVEEAERAAGGDRERAVRMLVDAATHLVRATSPGAVGVARRAAELAAGLGPQLEAMADVALGAALVLDGAVDEGRVLLRRYEELLDDLSVLVDGHLLLAAVPLVLIWLEELDEGTRLLRHLIDVAERHAILTVLPLALVNLATIKWALGAWDDVEQVLEEAVPLAQQTGQDVLVAPALATLALTYGAQGRTDDCRRAADRALRQIGTARATSVRRTIRAAFANLALGHGRAGEAVAALEPELATGPSSNPAPSLWEADLADALALAGRRDEAAALLDDLETRVSGTGNGRSRAAMLRSRGLLAPPADIDAVFAEAASLLSEPPIVYPLGRVHFYWGVRLVEAGRPEDAAAHFTEAARLFAIIGAGSWSRQASAALAHCRRADPTEPAAHEPAGPGYALSVLGRLSVRTAEGEALPLRGQPADVVRILAVRAGTVHEEHLMEDLWPEIDPERGRTRLRNVLARVRKVAPGLVVREGDVVALAPGTPVDASDFERAADAALTLHRQAAPEAADAIGAAAAMYGDDVLIDSPYQPWAVAARERLRARYVQLLDAAVDLADAADDADGLTSAADRAIEVDRFDEDRYVRVARSLQRLGRPSRALQYLATARSVAAELGVRAGPEVERLSAALRTP